MNLKDLKIRMEFKRIGTRPDGLMDNLPNHFRVHIHRNGIYRRFYYSMGSAWGNADPELLDVLDCLLGEYSTTFSLSEFCEEFGYDEDSRTAEKIFKEVLKSTEKLDDLFGDLDIEELKIAVSNWREGEE